MSDTLYTLSTGSSSEIGRFVRRMILAALGLLICNVTWGVAELANKAPGFSKVCGPDMDKYCPDVPWISSFLRVCLEQHKLELSKECAALWIEGSSVAEKAFYEHRPNPKNHALALWTPKNAARVQFFRRGTGDHLTYELMTAYPADALVKEFNQWFTSNGWTIPEEPEKADWQTMTDPDERTGRIWERQRKDSRGQSVHVILAYWGTVEDETPRRLRASIHLAPVRSNPFYKEGAISQAAATEEDTRSTDQPHELDKELTLRSHHEKWLDHAETLMQHQQDIDMYHLKGCPNFKTHRILAQRHLARLEEYRSAITKERQWLRGNPATYNGTIMDDVRQLSRIEHIRSANNDLMTDDARIIDEQQAMLEEDAATEGIVGATSSANEIAMMPQTAAEMPKRQEISSIADMHGQSKSQGGQAMKQFTLHPGTIRMIDTYDGSVRVVKADETPELHRFVYLDEAGIEVSSASQALERVPIVEVQMTPTDEEGNLVPKDRAQLIRIKEFGAKQRLLRSTTMTPQKSQVQQLSAPEHKPHSQMQQTAADMSQKDAPINLGTAKEIARQFLKKKAPNLIISDDKTIEKSFGWVFYAIAKYPNQVPIPGPVPGAGPMIVDR